MAKQRVKRIVLNKEEIYGLLRGWGVEKNNVKLLFKDQDSIDPVELLLNLRGDSLSNYDRTDWI